jgi:sugar O-acyltransferase (sialic acid O-acetyltransferase NeuD family)
MTRSNAIAIWGTGGFAREVHEVLRSINERADSSRNSWQIVGYLDDNVASHGTQLHGLPVLGGSDWLAQHPDTGIAVGVGSPKSRRRIVERLTGLGHTNFPTLVHPLTWIGSAVHLGLGTIVCAGCMITTDIHVGDFSILNLSCTVGHDARIEPFVTLAPAVNVSGNVVIETGCDIGTNACLIQGVRVGHWSVCGAGATVVKDLPANCTAVGSPARAIKERPEGWQLES